MAISQDEREFFIALGSRMAEQRKRLNITQMQMAETLSVSQQTVNAYESGQRRVLGDHGLDLRQVGRVKHPET